MRLRPITIAVALMAIAAAWQLFQHHYPRPLPVRETITGSAYAIDGDTLRMDGRRIRLVGIDTCESGQPARRAGNTIDCGDWAKWLMVEKIRDHRVRCDLHGQGPVRARPRHVFFRRNRPQQSDADRRRGVPL